MTNTTISAENLGPISSLEFALQSPGVTVLVAPNGSGKSILLEAVQAAARGEGKLPLRDRTKRGKVEAFGATITIGGTCRHTGGFEVSNLEGRFDLAALVDPRIKSPAAADRARIKALVALTGVAADFNLFKGHEAFDDFDEVVRPTSLETDDLVEMAARIKDDYDRAALAKENYAQRESGQWTALSPPADLDLNEESDSAILQAAYNNARDTLTRLEEQARAAKASQASIEQSKLILNDLSDKSLVEDRSRIMNEVKAAKDGIALKSSRVTELQLELRQLQTEIAACENVVRDGNRRIEEISASMAKLEQAKQAVTQAVTLPPDEQDIADAKDALAEAQAAMDLGARIRLANNNLARAQQHKQAAKEANDKAAKYRDAGKLTDEVLSNTIQCKQLRVESDGKSARLVTDTQRGKSINYHDLSEGERWTLAIDIGAEQVGAGGLLVISQVGWEGIDGANRLAIHQHAVNRGVYILTAEAASDPAATREIIPKHLPAVEPESIAAPAPKPTPAPAKSPAKPPAKPPEKPPAKKPAPTPPPSDSMDDEIPF